MFDRKRANTNRLDRMPAADGQAVLKAIWLTKPVAARDVRQPPEAILSAAKAAGHRKGDNPAAWQDNLQHLMPKTKRKGKVRGPHKSLPYEDLPAFMQDLAAVDTIGARILETSILTVARTNEIISMGWPDIDMDKAIW